MNKYLSAGAALVAVQAVLAGGYLLVRESRGGHDAPLTAAPETITAPLPALSVRYADGSTGDVTDLRGRPLLLHFWATWCRPCRKELPGLLDLADQGAAQVVLVALDDDWEPVRRFLDRPVPAHIALADGGQVERRFDVRELPESFFVDRAGRMTLRFRGARDWTDATTLEWLPVQLGQRR